MIHFGFHLGAGLCAGDGHAFGIDDHHIITHLHAGREGRFMLSKQDMRDARGNASKVLTLGIHKHPLAFDFASFRIVRLVHFQILRFLS
jgi:hypothetical protein